MFHRLATVFAVLVYMIGVPTAIGEAQRSTSHKAAAVVTVADPTSLHIMVLGDSISQGCGAIPITGWCAEFVTLLQQRGISATITAYAIGGWSCGALAPGFPVQFDAQRPNLVIMNCGTNDVPNNQPTKDAMGQSWRSMVEYAHVHGALVLPTFIQYSNIEINANMNRAWLLPGESNANDVIYVNMMYYYYTPGWFVGIADLQKVPGDLNYLGGGNDGIHPNALGAKVYAMIFYRALRGYYAWPDTVAEPCGMWGHRFPYAAPNFVSCQEVS